ncbi:DUF4864 domain-containing protein [Gymnodinialimonas sp. 2305UL16-5]|uniref:DUF4864 domain-containing protein n=1 Tax=Gymnodinialimonas mytili TaxID=3126503 RepID=UPI0030A77AF5
MIRIFALCLALILSAAFAAQQPAQAQEMLAPNPDIEATIGAQFDAFRREDIQDAWQYASPMIQGLFGNPDRFGQMVQNGYPMVWDPAQVEFIDLQTLGGVIVQRVEVVDQAGTLHYLGYAMVETENGWRINAVQVLRAPALGA